MPETAVTGSPGFISIAVRDVNRSAGFYQQYLGAVRDTFDSGPDAVAFVGWPAFALSSRRRPGQPGPSPEATSIQLWWRATDAQSLYERAAAAGVPILLEPFDGPFGQDLRHGGSGRLPDHDLREGSAALLAAEGELMPASRASRRDTDQVLRASNWPWPEPRPWARDRRFVRMVCAWLA